jgi:hypothetical protein
MSKQTPAYDGISIKPTKDHPAFYIGQGQSGAYSGSPGTSTSGYYALEEIIPRLAEGGYVFDKRGLTWDVACNCISGPMSSCELAPMSVDRWDDKRTFNTYEEFAAYEQTVKAEGGNLSMSYLSLDLYAEWWRRLGAKVGRKVKGEIVWKEGKV